MPSSRVVIVTGGTRGIGAAIAAAFVAHGDRVVVAGRGADAATDAERLRHVACDVTSRADVQRLIAAATAWGDRVDVLVNNAGMSAWRPLEGIDERFWHDMIAANLTSVLLTTQAAAPAMSGGGAIINVSSLAGKRGSANNAAYCAAKFGVNGLTQSLAKELGPRGIRVNAVCPVYVRTEGLLDALADADAPPQGRPIDAYLEEFAGAQAALRRLPTGDEVAAACVMLASPAASAVTGQCLNVDCGVLPQ
jgi:NAD(P)-dependent dehydrogenase (short-subunit alcohol dehydrogenase family)